jgi:hypothetical protein
LDLKEEKIYAQQNSGRHAEVAGEVLFQKAAIQSPAVLGYAGASRGRSAWLHPHLHLGVERAGHGVELLVSVARRGGLHHCFHLRLPRSRFRFRILGKRQGGGT